MARVTLSDGRRLSGWVAGATVVFSVLLFLILAGYSPDAPGQVDEQRDLSPGLYAALQAILATVLTIGVIEWFAEVLFRERNASELHRFLKLRASTVSAQLEDIVREDAADWRDILARATDVKVLLRNPMSWLPQHQHLLLEAARRQSLELVVGVPDEDDAFFEATAASCGLQPAQLVTAIATAVQALEQAWDGETLLKGGTRFQVVTYAGTPSYETVITTDIAAILLGTPVPSGPQSRRLAITFGRDTSGGGPSRSLAEQTTEMLDGRTSIMDKKA